MSQAPILFGLGTGRSGSSSLARLLNEQEATVCFHEMNPSCMRWTGSEGTVHWTVRSFQHALVTEGARPLVVDWTRRGDSEAYSKLEAMETITTIGDVGFYYLPYVQQILELAPDTRFPAMRRTKDDVVESMMRKLEKRTSRNPKARLFRLLTRKPIRRIRNPFVDESRRDVVDPVWDKCFPRFNRRTLRENIEAYWEHYNEELVRLEQATGAVRVFDLGTLSTPDGQHEILEFCGFSNPVLKTFHVNRRQA